MKYIDLKDKSIVELKDMLKENKDCLQTLMYDKKTMQLTNTSELRAVKKEIAQINTAITACGN